MVIRFACQCGKRLTAPKAMRGRQIQCPACFSLVDIPGRRSLFSTGARHSKGPRSRATPTASQPPPTETLAGFVSQLPGYVGPSTFIPARPVSDGEIESIRLRRVPRWTRLLSQRVEPRWYHSLTYPLANVPVFLRLSVLLSLLTALAIYSWVSIDAERPENWSSRVLAGSLLLLFYVLGCTFNYFNAILALASQGKTKLEPGMNGNPLVALKSCGLWLACFLSGPILVFGGAYLYWLNCGDLSIVDWTILIELGCAGIGWWLFALLLANADDTARLPFPLPQKVVRTGLRMRGKAIELILLATAIFAGHLALAVYGLAHLHEEPFLSIVRLCIFWCSGLYLTAFTFRRIGLAYYRLGRERPNTSSSAPDAGRKLFQPVFDATDYSATQLP